MYARTRCTPQRTRTWSAYRLPPPSPIAQTRARILSPPRRRRRFSVFPLPSVREASFRIRVRCTCIAEPREAMSLGPSCVRRSYDASPPPNPNPSNPTLRPCVQSWISASILMRTDRRISACILRERSTIIDAGPSHDATRGFKG